MTPSTIAQLIDSPAAPSYEWLWTHYKWMHQHPELSLEEEHTAAYIQRVLHDFDCEVKTGIGGHGIVAIFRNGEGPTALMRADFDGLPVTEATGADYASLNGGCMHACGHDVHTTALLGACKLLDAVRSSWSGTFIALFQPAEEVTQGASMMLADGLGELIPRPDVCFGQHILPGPAGTVFTTAGPAAAACDTLTITIHGRSSHGSMPHLGVDPTIVAAHIILRLQSIVGREVYPGDFAVITVGKLHAGTRNNIVPETAELVLNTRFYDEEVRDRCYRSIERVVKAECEASACPAEPEIVYSAHGELTDNSPEVFDTIRPVFDAGFGQRSQDATPWTASDDFSEIPRHFGAPYVYWTLGMTPQEVWDADPAAAPSNHQPDFLPDPQPTLTAAWQAAALAPLSYLAK